MDWLKNKLRVWLGINKSDYELSKLDKSILNRLEQVNNKVDHLAPRLEQARSDIAVLTRLLNEYLRVDADIGHRGANTIVLTGVLRGKGYVQFYDVSSDEFINIVERMRDMHKCNLIRNLDAPHNFSGNFEFK